MERIKPTIKLVDPRVKPIFDIILDNFMMDIVIIKFLFSIISPG